MLDPLAISPSEIRPLRRAEYELMVEQGVFDDERIELLRGVLVTRSPQGPRDFETIKRLTKLLVFALAGRADLLVHSSLAVADDSEPEPDLALVPARDYSAEVPSQAFLVIEVAQSSLRKDRGVKGPLYAAAGIPEYWIVDLAANVIEVHTEPRGEAYGVVTRRVRGETIALVAFPDVRVAVSDVIEHTPWRRSHGTSARGAARDVAPVTDPG